MNWFYWALATALVSTAYNLMGRVVAVKSQDARVFSVIFGAMASVMAFFYFLIEPFSFKAISVPVIGLTIVSTILMAVFERLQFYVRKEIDASTLSIIFRLIPAVSVVASIIFLKESVTLPKIIAVLLIVGGNLVVAVTKGKGKFKLDKATGVALIAATALGLAWTADKGASIGYSASLYALIAWILPTIYNFLSPPISIGKIKTEWKSGAKGMILLAFLNVLVYYLQIKTITMVEASKAVPIMSMSTIFVVIFGIIFLKERSNVAAKIVASILVVVGAIVMKLS
jgi:drug/metabolite transporter (DMT)-like permease